MNMKIYSVYLQLGLLVTEYKADEICSHFVVCVSNYALSIWEIMALLNVKQCTVVIKQTINRQTGALQVCSRLEILDSLLNH